VNKLYVERMDPELPPVAPSQSDIADSRRTNK
jgi:hypothetical protein